jgi:PAS domain S-box-containing protein
MAPSEPSVGFVANLGGWSDAKGPAAVTNRDNIEGAARFAVLVESSADAIIGVDSDARILIWNKAAEALFKYSANEAVGQPISIIWPEHKRAEAEANVAAVRRGESVVGFETERLAKDGTLCSVSITLSPVFNDQGDRIGSSMICRDISRRLELERELRHSQKLEALAMMTARVAHDFNNQLMAIMGYTDLALASERCDDVDRSLTQVRMASERAAALVGKLLAFGRKRPGSVEPVGLNEQVRRTAELIRSLLSPDIEFELRLQDQLDSVRLDPVGLDQVLMNLAVNASDAMPAGGRLTITTRQQRLVATDPGTGVPAGTWVVIDVADTGSGIDEALQPLVFEPFLTTKPEGKGTGLGLSTVKDIVDQAGGFVAFDSRPGQGTVFHVYHHAADGRAERLESTGSRAGRSERPKSVLLLEDDDQLRALMTRVLTEAGHDVAAFSSTHQALVWSGLNSVQLLIADLLAPGMGGMDFVKRLRATNPRLAVLVLSGNGGDAPQLPASSEGFGFAQKPISPSELVDVVDSLTGRA